MTCLSVLQMKSLPSATMLFVHLHWESESEVNLCLNEV